MVKNVNTLGLWLIFYPLQICKQNFKKKIKNTVNFIFFSCNLCCNKYINFLMIRHQTKVKVRYGETDQMGVVYHGNYAQYFEIGRIEWLSSLGFSYKEMEAQGIMLPVVVLNISYSKPAFYDEILTIKTTLLKLPKASIEFEYELYNERDELLTKAYTKLVFVDKKTRLPMRCPDYFLDKLQN